MIRDLYITAPRAPHFDQQLQEAITAADALPKQQKCSTYPLIMFQELKRAREHQAKLLLQLLTNLSWDLTKQYVPTPRIHPPPHLPRPPWVMGCSIGPYGVKQPLTPRRSLVISWERTCRSVTTDSWSSKAVPRRAHPRQKPRHPSSRPHKGSCLDQKRASHRPRAVGLRKLSHDNIFNALSALQPY